MSQWRQVLGYPLLVIAGFSTTAFSAPVEVPHNFTAGTPAVAANVNANFNAVATAVNDNHANITSLQTVVNNLQTQVNTLTTELAAANARITTLENTTAPGLRSDTFLGTNLLFLNASGQFILAAIDGFPGQVINTGFQYQSLPGQDEITIDVENDNTVVLIQALGEAYITQWNAFASMDVALFIDGVMPTQGAQATLRMVSDDNISSGGSSWNIVYPVTLSAGTHTISVKAKAFSTNQSSITIDQRDGRSKLVVTRVGAQ